VGIKEFQDKHQHLGECVEVFKNQWATELERVFIVGVASALRNRPEYKQVQAIKVFGEFLGENSFAGLHRSDEPKEIKLFWE
jgi:hypothetical protein